MTKTTDITAALDAQLAADTARKGSVVRSSYKAAYRDRAETARGKKGVDRRVIAQSCGDWLALELAARIRPNPKKPTDLALFRAILAANGVDDSRWPSTTPGWQGRLRMSGGMALRAVVAEAGVLVVPGEGELSAPRSWCAKHGG